MKKAFPGTFFLHAVAPFLAWAYVHLAALTTRVKTEHITRFSQQQNSGNRCIYAVWHARLFFLIPAHRRLRICALVSRSRDGEYLARMLRLFGIASVRGSTSKGGPQALMGLLDMAEAGYSPAVTPDGPKGPGRRIQPGIIYLAQKTSLPIIPVGCGLSRKLVFSSWDRFEVPLPFGRAAVVYGKPVFVSSADSVESKTSELEKNLNRATDRADMLVRNQKSEVRSQKL
ncbi:MAG: lysophospholipid acyltransferase family protein [bacterium]